MIPYTKFKLVFKLVTCFWFFCIFQIFQMMNEKICKSNFRWRSHKTDKKFTLTVRSLIVWRSRARISTWLWHVLSGKGWFAFGSSTVLIRKTNHMTVQLWESSLYTVALPTSERSRDASSNAQSAEHEVGCVVQWAPFHWFIQSRGDQVLLLNFERFPLFTLHRYITPRHEKVTKFGRNNYWNA